LWVLRYSDSQGDFVHRVLVSSRNLTFDRSWDLVVAIEEDPEGTSLSPIASALDACLGNGLSVMVIPTEAVDRVSSVSQSLRRAAFAVPEPFASMRAHPLGFGATARRTRVFPPAAHRALVVSPFLKRSLIERMPQPWSQTTIVAPAHELDREFGPGSGASASDRPLGRNLNPALTPDDQESVVLSGLHAKAFVFDEPGRVSTVFMGSANATEAAFTHNVELLLELKGPTRKVGVAAIVEDEGFASMLIDHVWAEQMADPPDDDAELDAVRNLITAQPLAIRATALDPGRFSLRYILDMPVPSATGVKVSVRPITASASRQLVPGEPFDVAFDVTEVAITSFLGVRLERPGAQSLSFVLTGPLEGEPEARVGGILAQLLASPDRLVRYLLLLLMDPSTDRFDASTQAVVEHLAARGQSPLDSVPLLEVMARALAGDRRRLREVDRLLRQIVDRPELVTADLRELWQSVSAAAALSGGVDG
jgi:hypothetical protein